MKTITRLSLAVLVSIAACTKTNSSGSRDATSSVETATAVAAHSAAATGTDRSPFGVHRDGPFPRSAERIDEIMDQVQSSGASWLRVNFPWDWIEREDGLRDWNRADMVVEAAEHREISLLVTVRNYTRTDLFAGDPEAKLSAYESFVHELVARYKDRIKYWQIENEVTAEHMWRSSLDEYVTILQVAYRSVKAEDSLAQVLLSSFGSNFTERMVNTPESTEGGQALEELRFILREGAGSYDIVDAHVYHRVRDVPHRVEFYREEARPFTGDIPIWITETGGPDPRVDDGPGGGSAADQVPKRYALATSAGAERIFWHQIAVRQGRDTNWSGMALIEGAERRSAFDSYRLMTDKLKGYSMVERVTATGDVSVYRFAREAGDVYLAWADAPDVAFTLPFAADSLRLTHVNGREEIVDAATLSAGPSPIYLEIVH
jgi:hypothetical protein